jgi:uncharacterized protein YcbK (DUF882 family)
MATRLQFEKWAKGLQLRYISPSELLTKIDNPGNTLPPEDMWKNIVRPAQILDMLRESFQKPVSIHSTYRSPAYNTGVGGASQSQHLQFNAIDFSISGVTPGRCFNRLQAWRDAGLWKGGLGKYPTFVHIDERGNDSTW